MDGWSITAAYVDKEENLEIKRGQLDVFRTDEIIS
jgi:hypothetical protein